jgi:hypothetical protein
VGVNALVNATGNGNMAMGFSALADNTSGIANTAVGEHALSRNISGRENTATGFIALTANTTGHENTAYGSRALQANAGGCQNTAVGAYALNQNSTGCFNTGIGFNANVATVNLRNATAIGYFTIVDASNKIRLGNAQVTVVEAQVGLTVVSDGHQKEGFRPVDGEGVLKKIRHLDVPSWNYIGHDARQFRHYGPMAQDFHAAFGNDGVGAVGTPTTITSTDMDGILLIALKAVEQRTEQLRQENQLLRAALEELRNEIKRAR